MIYLEESFTSWASGNNQIDRFIRRMRLNITRSTNIILEWIPYNQFNNIKKIGKNMFATFYLAEWKDGPLEYNEDIKKYERNPNEVKVVFLKYFHNMRDIYEFLDKVHKEYRINSVFYDNVNIYGISQHPYSKKYIIVLQNLKHKEICQIDRNTTIENLVQEIMHLNNNDILFEYIPHNNFDNVNKMGENLYSAIWKDDSLNYDIDIFTNKYEKYPNRAIILKYLYNMQDVINEVNKYLVRSFDYNFLKIYGISQNPDSKYYTIIFNENYFCIYHCKNCGELYTNIQYKWCKSCQMNYIKNNFANLISRNEKVNDLTQGMQLKNDDMTFRWISYDQFNNNKLIGKNNLLHTVMWKDGSLNYNAKLNGHEFTLKIKGVINKIKETKNFSPSRRYSRQHYSGDSSYRFEIICPIVEICGLFEDPHIKSYIMIFNEEYLCTYYSYFCKNCSEIYTDKLYKWCKPCQINYLKENFTNWTSGNKTIDNFIQVLQSNINQHNDLIFEWISYSQFDDIKKIGKHDFATVYSAKWKDGPLIYNKNTNEYERYSLNSKVSLKIFHNIQLIDEFLYKVKMYLMEYPTKAFGISQDPDTDNYILIQHKEYEACCGICDNIYTNVQFEWCKQCQINNLKEKFTNQASGNKEVDNYIQELQLKINNYNNIIAEWIPYDQFEIVEEIGKDDLSTVYLAKWKVGPLHYDVDKREYTRISNEIVILKFLDNSKFEFLNKVKEITNKFDKFKINVLEIYGISQDPNTDNYIIVFHNKRCIICGKHYITYEWCKFCHIEKFISLNGNKKIDDLIQEMQLRIHNPGTIVFEWIPYDQFNNIEKIDEGGFSIIYSAIWKNGPLSYDSGKMEYIRESYKKVALKCLNISQNLTNEFLNEIKKYSTDTYSRHILRTYGISQNSYTNDYIIVLEYAESGNFNNWINKNYENFYWLRKFNILQNIVNGLKEIHQKGLVHRDLHTGNILLMTSNFGNDVSSISDMGLCGEIGNTDVTKIYGVMPYVAPEILRGNLYTQAADIYSFGMIMYFVATGKQPFANRAHDKLLALDIANKGIRPEIDEFEVPKCYIDLMKNCWDPNPINRPNVIEIDKLISSFHNNVIVGKGEQFKESKGSIENNQPITHSQAIYTSRLLNPFTKDLNSACLDCAIID
ncbi:hypothetical protein RclHR1_00290035 [Rhizophagus clarus]|uniref:Protein kinase domain-containing protein n=1 Tax=Rhizophagus clarus TaxID=94130 RepID=A0A2Z6R3R6_9GLOM|nr:hypothetical protein RclHR1_00290035 [Rhizophagus clarus]